MPPVGFEDFDVHNNNPSVTISAESFRSYLTLPWNDPRGFQTLFDKKNQEFHEKNSAIESAKEQEYSNLCAIHVLWKPLAYEVVTGTAHHVTVKLQDDLTPAKIRRIFKEAELVKDGKPVTAEELLKCQHSELREKLPFFIQKLISAQIFFNRLTSVDYLELETTTNFNTRIPTNTTILKRFFTNLETHKHSPLDIETYYKLEYDDRLMPHETFMNFFRIMFSPVNISESDPTTINRTRSFSGDPEQKLAKLFESNASLDNVATLMNNLLKTSESDKKYKGSSYNVEFLDLSSNKFPILEDEKTKGTIDEHFISISLKKSAFKVEVASDFGDDDLSPDPVSIELKNFRALPRVFDRLVIDLEKMKQGKEPKFDRVSEYWYNMLSVALVDAWISLSPFVMISNMHKAYIITFPPKELFRLKPDTIFSHCDLYGPIELSNTPVSLLISVMAFKGTIDSRNMLRLGYNPLMEKLIRSQELGKEPSMESVAWTYGAEYVGKRQRDIERERVSMEAFSACLGLGLPRAGDCDQENVPQMINEIEKLPKRFKDELGFFIRNNEKRYKPPIEPIVLQTTDFVVQRILRGQDWFTGDEATTIRVRQTPGPESYILKVYDPVKLNCIAGVRGRFDDYETDLPHGFLHNTYCLISESFLREVSAYLILKKKLKETYTDYVPELISYGFLENKRIRDDSTSAQMLYEPFVLDSAGTAILNKQGGFVLIEHLAEVKDPGKTIEEDEKIKIAKEGVNTLKKIHRAGVLHGNMKWDNVVLTKSKTGKCVLKIIDFGHSKNPVKVERKRKSAREDTMEVDSTDSAEDNEGPRGFFVRLSEDSLKREKDYEIESLKDVLVDLLDLRDVEIDW